MVHCLSLWNTHGRLLSWLLGLPSKRNVAANIPEPSSQPRLTFSHDLLHQALQSSMKLQTQSVIRPSSMQRRPWVLNDNSLEQLPWVRAKATGARSRIVFVSSQWSMSKQEINVGSSYSSTRWNKLRTTRIEEDERLTSSEPGPVIFLRNSLTKTVCRMAPLCSNKAFYISSREPSGSHPHPPKTKDITQPLLHPQLDQCT